MKQLIYMAALCFVLPVFSVANIGPPAADKDGLYFPAAVGQTEADEYTRYELLAPETASFKIYYEVTATTAGAQVLLQPDSQGQRRQR